MGFNILFTFTYYGKGINFLVESLLTDELDKQQIFW